MPVKIAMQPQDSLKSRFDSKLSLAPVVGNFRAVALDLDGTLLHSNHKMSDAAVAYLRHLSSRGIQIIIATGRAGPTVMEHVAKLNLPGPLPVVCSNGARGLFCQANGPNGGDVSVDEIFTLPIPHDITKRAVKLAKKLGQVVQYFNEDDIYANPTMKHHYSLTERYTFKTGSRIIHQSPLNTSFDDLLKKNKLPCKLLILCPKEDLNKVRAAYEKEFCKNEATLIYGKSGVPQGWVHEIMALEKVQTPHGGWFIEILNPQVCKGAGLERMCEILDVKPKDAVAFGDGDNDVEFLKVAGKGFAMKNGRAKVKKIADEVTEHTNNEDGVLRTLQRMERDGELQM